MPWGRRLGATFGLLALIALCIAGVVSNYQGRFWSGYQGIGSDLEAKAGAELARLGVPDAEVEADGQDLTVRLPDGTQEAVEESVLTSALRNIDGVRGVTTSYFATELGTPADPDTGGAGDGAGDGGDAAAEEPDPGDSAAGAAEEEPVVAEEPGRGPLVLKYEGYRVVLQGPVETHASEAVIVRAAENLVGADKVVGELTVTGGEGVDFKQNGAAAGVLARLDEWFDTATVTLSDRYLQVSGEPLDADSAAAATQAVTNLADSVGLEAVLDIGAEQDQADPDPTPPPVRASDIAEVQEIFAAADLGSIEFEPDTATMVAPSHNILDAIGEALVETDPVPFEVQGHSSSAGDPDVNLLLSQERAEAVREYLVRVGVDRELMTAVGFGAAVPVADEATVEGQAANERIEFVVVEGNN